MRAASPAFIATTNVPSARRSMAKPLAASSSVAKAGQSDWLRRPNATRSCSPGSASAQIASMPAAAWLAPDPAAARSNTVTRAPLWASRQATPSPMTPAPTMITSGREADEPPDDRNCRLLAGIGGSLRWHDPDRFNGFDLSRAPRGTPVPLPYHRQFWGWLQGPLRHSDQPVARVERRLRRATRDTRSRVTLRFRH